MKMFKKVIALATSAVMLVSCTAFAATTTATIDQSNEKVTVTVELGASKANSKVTVNVFKPASNGFSDLGTDGTATDVDAVISYAYEHTADASGVITFTYKPQAASAEKYGNYFVRAAGEDAGSFEYITDIDKASIITDLKTTSTAANVEAVFAAAANANVYTEAQRLELEENVQFYSEYAAASPEVKANVYAYIAGRMNTVTTLTDFYALFDKAVYVSVLNSKEGTDLLSFIDTNKTYSGVDSQKAYTYIRENTDYFTTAVQTNALLLIDSIDMMPKDLAQTSTAIGDALLVALLSSCVEYGVMDTVIGDFAAEITANGGNADGYTSSTSRLSYANQLKGKQPFENMADFVAELNAVVGAVTTITPSNPGGIVVDTPSNTGSTGGSGGGGFGGGTSLSRPTPNTNIFTDNNTQGSTPAATSFTDLKGYEWAEQAIKTLKEKNIVGGKSATEFAPADTVLREEFAKMIMLAVLSANVQSATATDFTDVDPNAWYAPYIAAATKSGVINGYGSTFGLGDTIRREDMAVMCYRAIKAAGITLNAEREAHKFTDAISDYAKEAIASMYAAGLINGYSETEFNGNGTATRAEAAMILYNVVQKYM